jgi:hypothetical protein
MLFCSIYVSTAFMTCVDGGLAAGLMPLPRALPTPSMRSIVPNQFSLKHARQPSPSRYFKKKKKERNIQGIINENCKKG